MTAEPTTPPTRTPQPGDRVRCYGHFLHVVPDGTEGIYVRKDVPRQHVVDLGTERGLRLFDRVELVEDPATTTDDQAGEVCGCHNPPRPTVGVRHAGPKTVRAIRKD